MFQPVSASANLPRQEEEILRFWKERGIYEKSLAPAQRGRAGSSSTKVRRRPTACRTRATA